MRTAIVRSLLAGTMTPRTIVDRALVDFEAAVKRLGTVRPALLFAERDRIARELHAFVASRLARRLRAQRRPAVVAVGRAAAPFDIVIRNRAGASYAVVLRRLPGDGRRLAFLQRVRAATQTTTRKPVDGILVYDFARGTTVLLDQAGSKRVHSYLRAS